MAKILIACEESQKVCLAFRRQGYESYSCDVEPCSGGHPEYHIKQDIREIVSKYDWDLMIAHPPCDHLAVSGARWFAWKRKDGRQQKAMEFFRFLATVNIPKIAIENPVGIMSTKFKEPDQYIQPYQFGHGETKKTCLWLKNLPLLKPINEVEGRENRIWKMPPSKDRGKQRSKTYPGIADAMAKQWGEIL